MKRQIISGAILSVALFMVSSSASAATISFDLDVIAPGIQNTRIINPGSEFEFEVVFTGDGVTQFDTFALNVAYNNSGQVLASTSQQPIAGTIADTAPLMALDIFSGSSVSGGDTLTLGNLPTPEGFSEGLGGAGLSSVGGMAFPQLAEGETISLFHSSLHGVSYGTSLLELTGYPFGVDTELSLGGNGVAVELQGALLTVVPLPPAVWLFMAGLLGLIRIGHESALRACENKRRVSLRRGLLAAFVLTAPVGHATLLSNADLNGDAIVNSLDISKLSSCFGQDPASNSDCSVTDVDTDGDIDRDDFAFISAHLGETYPWALYPSPVFSGYLSHELESSALGDVNKDGIPDIVVLDWQNWRYESKILVFAGRVDGRFQLVHHFNLEESPTEWFDVSLVDLNRDDILDLVLVGDGGISIQFGHGDGSFQTQQWTTAFENASAVSFGDLDGDSDLDFVAVSEESGAITPFLNVNGHFDQGDGTVISNGGPNSVVMGDLNNDGALDFVVSNGLDNSVIALICVGDGTIVSRQHFAVGNQPSSLILGELNGDGLLDLVVANASSNDISVLLGSEFYTFQAEQRYHTGYEPKSLDLGDINGDDTLDLIIANHQTGDLSLFLGNRDGSFKAEQRLDTGGDPRKVFFSDFDGDNRLDLVISGRKDVFGLLGNGDGSFHTPRRRFTVGDEPVSADLGDINGDGLLDLAVANSGSNDVSILLGKSAGGFQSQLRFSVGESPNSLVLGDVDGDGNLDLATINNYTDISILLGNGDGTFQPQIHLSAGNDPQSLALGDLNADGAWDIAVSNRLNDVLVLLSNSDGTFQEPKSFRVGRYPSDLALGDLNGDGNLDLAVVNGNFDGDVSVLIGNGNGGFQDDRRYYRQGWGSGEITLGDLDNDGDLDMVITDFLSGYVVTMIGDGEGSFRRQRGVGVYMTPRRTTLGDINRDGILDIVSQAREMDAFTYLLLGDGRGGILSYQRFFRKDYSGLLLLALKDFNRDGSVDLLVTDGSNGVSIIYNFSTGR
jgi:hypothetical protein